MPIEILMPALSPTMEKGNLAKWHKKTGDLVKPGDVLAEIETDKATMEVEAVDEGRMGKILVAEGTEDVAVNAPIAVLLLEGENEEAAQAASSSVTKQKPQKLASPASDVSVSAPKAETAPVVADKSSEKRIFVSPLARRLAREHGVDLAFVQGSGPKGRIVAEDILSYAQKAGQKTPGSQEQNASFAQTEREALASSGTGELKEEDVFKIYAPETYTLVPHETMRKVIAQRLTIAKATIPHFYLAVDCFLTDLLAMRERLNAQAPLNSEAKPTFKLSINDFIVKALGYGLRRVPLANVSWSSRGMLQHKGCDVGVAVAIPGGLMTPVVRDVDQKGLSELSNTIKELAQKARARKLLPQDYQGGSTSVSNLGMYGISAFSAVINPPQATILAVGQVQEKLVLEGGHVVPRSFMTLTLSTDHRAVDGALGAEFLGAVKAALEDPALLLV